MGNRAVVIDVKNMNKGVYIHWNGGLDSVQAFCKYCELLEENKTKVLSDEGKKLKGLDLFAYVVNQFFYSEEFPSPPVTVGNIKKLDIDNGDNGTFIIDEWEVVGRMYISRMTGEQQVYDLEDMLEAISEKMPMEYRLDYIRQAPQTYPVYPTA